jgi:hypothetical protein
MEHNFVYEKTYPEYYGLKIFICSLCKCEKHVFETGIIYVYGLETTSGTWLDKEPSCKEISIIRFLE